MRNKIKLFIFFIFFFTLFLTAEGVLAYQPKLIFGKNEDIKVNNPEVSKIFYDELKGYSRNYLIKSSENFNLYINILVPAHSNINGRYSINVFDSNGKNIYYLDGEKFDWKQFYDSFGRDYYVKGPELDKELNAGEYKIEVYSKDNLGKYSLAIGKKEVFDIWAILNTYWQLPWLKISFFKTSVLEFFITPIGIAGLSFLGFLIIVFALINYLTALIKEVIKHNMAKNMLLTSNGMQMKEEISKLLQKPAYDVTVAFISTAARPIKDLDYLKKDWDIMKTDMGFNVEEIDIEGKKEDEVRRLIEMKDIIFVAGGNTFYLLDAMRKCNFEKIIKDLLKEGKVYIGASAGSIVAGNTIKTAEWLGDKNIVGLKKLKGLGLVSFDIVCHYKPADADIIKQKIKNPKKRLKKLKIITDEQAILVQGKEVSLIGKGEAVII